MKPRVVVLMYHALWRDAAGLRRIDALDRPYALHVEAFAAQLDALLGQGLEVLDPARLRPRQAAGVGVVLSFDDGHASVVELALPLLLSRGLRAAVFVSTAYTDRRRGFCTTAQLRELADSGMLVGGHGHTHRFLSELGDAELGAELQQSQAVLRRALGEPARQMSFPGGRFDARCVRAAHAAGFELLYGSRVGAWAAERALPGAPLPRIAVRPGMSLPAFLDYARGDPARLLRARALAAAKRAARACLGEQRYHRLYASLRT